MQIITKLKFKSDIFKSFNKTHFFVIFFKLIFNFFNIYIKMSKNLSVKYYQENKEKLQKKQQKNKKKGSLKSF